MAPTQMTHAHLGPQRQGLVSQSISFDSNVRPHPAQPIEVYELQGSECSPRRDGRAEPATIESAALEEGTSDSSVPQAKPTNEQAVQEMEVVARTDIPRVKPVAPSVDENNGHTVVRKQQTRKVKKAAVRKDIPTGSSQRNRKDQHEAEIDDTRRAKIRKVELEQIEEIDLIDPDALGENNGVTAKHRSPSVRSTFPGPTPKARSIMDELQEFVDNSSSKIASG
jgi:hypothetical protein